MEKYTFLGMIASLLVPCELGAPKKFLISGAIAL